MEIQTVRMSEHGNIIVNDEIFVPEDSGNRHYQQIIEWLTVEGNEVEPYAPPESIPQVVSSAQGTMALYDAGLWASIEADYNAMPEGRDKFIMYQALYVTKEWRRDSPSLIAMANAKGLSDTDLDNLFIAAADIVL